MTDVAVLELAQRALFVGLEISAPILGLSLAAGLIISIFQAATQIQETTLTFIPKILAMSAALVVFGPWMLRTSMAFTAGLLMDLPKYAK